MSISGLTRYHDEHSGLVGNLAAVTKVRHWKVVTTAAILNDNITLSPPMALLDFCRTIRPSAPRSLEISVLPRGMAERRDSEYYLMRDFLSPLRMLRSIENSGIRDAVPAMF